jgi:SAM-dependent methyltransferase
MQSPFNPVLGLDLDLERLSFSQSFVPESLAVCGDGGALPFQKDTFGACVCHFLLLWVDDPSLILREMIRATRPKGWIMALAEPDYGGRIDYPASLESLGHWQTESLENQGAHPHIGRQLRSLFLQAGLVDLQVGILGGQWSHDSSARESLEQEWSLISADLSYLERIPTLESFKSAWFDPGRILYIPTFYAIGQVPD